MEISDTSYARSTLLDDPLALGTKVQAQSLVDLVAEKIEAAIYSGELEPGAKLSEPSLATSLGVSRSPLREAIRKLEGRRLLERTPNIGVRVATLSPADFLEILEVREALECKACALAAERMSDAEIAALGTLLDESERRGDTGSFPPPAELDFHLRIVMGSRNKPLQKLMTGDLYHLIRLYRYRSSIEPGRARALHEEHRAIVVALSRRDPSAAEHAMRQHMRNAKKHIGNSVQA